MSASTCCTCTLFFKKHHVLSCWSRSRASRAKQYQSKRYAAYLSSRGRQLLPSWHGNHLSRRHRGERSSSDGGDTADVKVVYSAAIELFPLSCGLFRQVGTFWLPNTVVTHEYGRVGPPPVGSRVSTTYEILQFDGRDVSIQLPRTTAGTFTEPTRYLYNWSFLNGWCCCRFLCGLEGVGSMLHIQYHFQGTKERNPNTMLNDCEPRGRRVVFHSSYNSTMNNLVFVSAVDWSQIRPSVLSLSFLLTL